jgi:hypothetical protein
MTEEADTKKTYLNKVHVHFKDKPWLGNLALNFIHYS